MSRVTAAFRRAAEQSTITGETAPGVDAGDDVRELAAEAFPIELPERRTFPADAAAPPPPVVADRRVQKVESASARNGAVFERIDAALAAKVVVDAAMAPASREQYRRLAAALHHGQTDTGLKVVMIASAVPGEGKTLTASNLALTLSESYQRSVLLIDGDLRRPAIHTLFRLDNLSGLTEGLASVEERPLRVMQVSRTLAVLPAGRATSDPMAGLTSQRMRTLIDEARSVFDWVIVDTPPIALLPDAKLLAAMVDGAVLVVKAGSTSYEMVKRAVDSLGREHILGTVLNRADTTTSVTGYDKAYYYGARAEAPVQQ